MNKPSLQSRNVLSVENLTVQYEEAPALWDATFSLESHQLVGIIGPNGAGKSTLLKSMLGFLKPLSGSCTYFGGQSLSSVQKRVAYVPQVQAIDWEFPITALEVVMMGDYHKQGVFKWGSKSTRQRALAALERLGMSKCAHRSINDMSGGQKQKLFIARALMQEADLYFFDEPFVGVDHTTQSELIALFQSMRDKGTTLVIVHHDLTTVESIFSHLLILNTYLVGAGPTRDVYTIENLRKAYGTSETILEKLVDLSREQGSTRHF